MNITESNYSKQINSVSERQMPGFLSFVGPSFIQAQNNICEYDMLTSHWWATPTSSETSLTHHIAGKMAVVQTFCDWVDVPIPPLKVFLP